MAEIRRVGRNGPDEEWETSSDSEEHEQSEIDEPRPEGYDFEFLNELSSEHTCPICLLAIRKPVQTTSCGHRFCEDCLLNAFRERRSRDCPQDRNPIPKREGYFRDLAWERVVLSLHVKCKQKNAGCKWTGELRQYEKHFQSQCENKTVNCHQCQKKMEQRFLAVHLTSECPNRLVQCKHCNKEFAFCHKAVHEGKRCAKFPLECPQKCGMNEIPREKVSSHVQQNCPMTMVGCFYEEAGCPFKAMRKYLAAHIEEANEYHLSKTWEKLRKTKQKVELLEKTQEKQNRTIGIVKEWMEKVDGMQTRLDAMERNARNKKRALEVSLEKKKKMKRMARNSFPECDSDEE